MSDTPEAGGWIQFYGVRIARALVIGSIAAGAGVAVTHYGTYNGGQQQFYCEAALTSQTTNKVTYSCLNPLPNGMSGAILKDTNGIVVVGLTASPKTTLDAGTATTAALSGTNLFSNILLTGAKRVLTVTGTGAIGASNYLVIAPGDSVGSKYLNFSFHSGSGQTTTGAAPAYVRIPIIPCNVGGVTC